MKKNIIRITGILLLFISFQSLAQVLPIIPMPASIKIRPGAFKLDKKTTLVIGQSELKSEASFLTDLLLKEHGIKIKTTEGKPGAGSYIYLQIQASGDNVEQYQLNIQENGIVISGNSTAGVFYGIQSLLQLMPAGKMKKIDLPFCIVEDKPAFKWRGMHLDCSRHFFSVSFIKKYIDCLAQYKMNVFHWHLTDDQGWRIEIKKYPKLTQIGGWRKGSMVGHYRDQKFDSVTYGGYYSQEEIKDVVKYAADRHVNIVPEIEMPGHALAALAAYPEYSCTGKKLETGIRWGVEEEVFCPTEETFNFLNDVLDEVVSLFPSRYIHIGGDEVLKDIWNQSAFCMQLMKEKNLKDAHELQSYFIRRIETMVNKKGRSIIGWDEILEGGLAPNAAVMSWRGTEGGKAAARQNHWVVMTPGSHCYFDHYQGKPESEPLAIGGFTSLEKVYSYMPVPDSLTTEQAAYIMGAQGNVWTEYIQTPEQVEYMAFPRMMALSEVVWSEPSHKNYDDFLKRLSIHRKRLDWQKINYCKTAFNKP